MIVGKLIVESFNYSVNDAKFPVFGDGIPLIDGRTGEQKTAAFKVLTFEVLPGYEIEIRVREEQWEDFLATLAARKVRAATQDDMRRLVSPRG